jgi:hypothetical protein
VFTNIQLDDGVLLQFAESPVKIQMQHYALLIDNDLFDRAYRRLCCEHPVSLQRHWMFTVLAVVAR